MIRTTALDTAATISSMVGVVITGAVGVGVKLGQPPHPVVINKTRMTIGSKNLFAFTNIAISSYINPYDSICMCV